MFTVYHQSRPNHVFEFCLVNILTFSKCVAVIFYEVLIYSYKYVHNVITNVLHLNNFSFLVHFAAHLT